ncbi:MAG TPA: glycosyltransferase family 4 protein [Anaerolineales bacterium]|nr:glycosyltransferase family 4 protein [Anaerolineales bacterium]
MKKSKAKRHCMIVHHAYPLAEPRVERESQALVKHGYEVDVLALQQDPPAPAFEVVEGVNVYRLPVLRDKSRGIVGQFLEYFSFFIRSFFKVSALHFKRKYGVVEAHNLPDFLVFAALIPKLMGAKVILNIHDVMPEFYAVRFKTGMSSWPVRLVRWQERISCWFADHVITVTELWRQSLIGRGVRADKTSVVMNLADERIFGDAKPADHPNGSREGFRLIYHGTITRRYGIDLLIQALDKVKSEIPGIHLTIHGGGEFRDEIMRMVKERNLDSYVYFSVNRVPSSELPKMIMKADLGIVPYRYDVFTDGILPTKLMEYAAVGVPVVAARTTAITAYFDNEMVHLFTPGDVNELAQSILFLYKDRTRLAQYAQNIEKFNERYNWRTVASQYVGLIDRLNQ